MSRFHRSVSVYQLVLLLLLALKATVAVGVVFDEEDEMNVHHNYDYEEKNTTSGRLNKFEDFLILLEKRMETTEKEGGNAIYPILDALIATVETGSTMASVSLQDMIDGSGLNYFLNHMAPKAAKDFVQRHVYDAIPKILLAANQRDTEYEFHDRNFVSDGGEYEYPLPLSRMVERMKDVVSLSANYVAEIQSVTIPCYISQSYGWGDGSRMMGNAAYPAYFSSTYHGDEDKQKERYTTSDFDFSVFLETNAMELPGRGLLHFPSHYCLDGLNKINAHSTDDAIYHRNPADESDDSLYQQQLYSGGMSRYPKFDRSKDWYDSNLYHIMGIVIQIDTVVASGSSYKPTFVKNMPQSSTILISYTMDEMSDPSFVEDAFGTPKKELLVLARACKLVKQQYSHNSSDQFSYYGQCLDEACIRECRERLPELIPLIANEMGIDINQSDFDTAWKQFKYLAMDSDETRWSPFFRGFKERHDFVLECIEISMILSKHVATPTKNSGSGAFAALANPFLSTPELHDILTETKENDDSWNSFMGALRRRLQESPLHNWPPPKNNISEWGLYGSRNLTLKALSLDPGLGPDRVDFAPNTSFGWLPGNLTDGKLGKTADYLMVCDSMKQDTIQRLFRHQEAKRCEVMGNSMEKGTSNSNPCGEAVNSVDVYLYVLAIVAASCGAVQQIMENIHNAVHLYMGLVRPDSDEAPITSFWCRAAPTYEMLIATTSMLLFVALYIPLILQVGGAYKVATFEMSNGDMQVDFTGIHAMDGCASTLREDEES
jgi:hypothetical protein